MATTSHISHLRDIAGRCCQSLRDLQKELHEAGAHRILSTSAVRYTVQKLGEFHGSLSVWDDQVDRGQRSNDPQTVNLASSALGQLFGRVETIVAVVQRDVGRHNYTADQRGQYTQQLNTAFLAIERILQDLQTLPQLIAIDGPDQHALQRDIRGTVERHTNIKEAFTNALRGTPRERRKSLDLKIAPLDFLWSELQRVSGVPDQRVWDFLPDGHIIDSATVDRARTVLETFCDAWLKATPETFEPKKLYAIRQMPKIFLILIYMDKRHYIDDILYYGVDDKSLPFSTKQVQDIFPESAKNDALFFEAEQYRVIPRDWRQGEHLQMLNREPLPFRLLEQYQGGAYSQVSRVEDQFTKQIYALKIQRHEMSGSKQHMRNEITNLKRLCDDGQEYHHHIVRFVKSYQRGNEFGVLFTPAATTNLRNLTIRYCDRPDSRADYKISLLRGFGCLSYSLAYVHNIKEIRHKDIKPQNILYQHFGPHGPTFLWSDFGLAKDFSGEGVSHSIGTFNSTPAYAAPEVLRYGNTHGRSADIFSLGCVFFEILSVIITNTLNPDNPANFLNFQPYHEHMHDIRRWAENMIGAEESRGDRFHLHIGDWAADNNSLETAGRRIRDLVHNVISHDERRRQPSLSPLLRLAKAMTDERANKRPKIAQVVKHLASMKSRGLDVFCEQCYAKVDNDHAHRHRILHRRDHSFWRLLPSAPRNAVFA